MPIPQVRFRGTTDAEGRLVWEAAPDQQLDFYVTAPGYVRRDDVLLSPDEDREHLVKLSPALVISGTVRNSVTHEPIPKFWIGIGWPEDGPDGDKQPRWSDIDRFWLKFDNGEFRHTLEEMVVGGAVNRGYVFLVRGGRAQAVYHAIVSAGRGRRAPECCGQPVSNVEVRLLWNSPALDLSFNFNAQ